MADTNPKPGWKTTEFAVTVLTVVGVVVLIALGKVTVDDVVRLWPIFIGSGGYAVSRGLTKMGK